MPHLRFIRFSYKAFKPNNSLFIYPISNSLNNVLPSDYKVHNILLDHERNLVDNSSHLGIIHVGGEQNIHSRNSIY